MTLPENMARLGSLAGSATLSALLLAGCSHHHHPDITYAPAPPPVTYPDRASPAPRATRSASPRTVPVPPVAVPSEVSPADADFIASHKPIYSQQGVASWYGPPYNNRQGANGKIFDQNALTAAHRTLPMGSLIVVTNEKTGQSATMRVTDRGPFVQGRELDLSMASAKATGIYRAGTANVRIDVYQTPRPIDSGGRWCVQIGAFEHENRAKKLQEELEDRYTSAQVIEFTGPTGHWVRIRPAGDNREQAELIQRRLRPTEGDAYLVRLD